MARIRSLKPDHKSHRKVGPLTDRQYRLWVGMITEADDEGRLVADAGQLRLQMFGYHPKTRVQHVEDALQALAEVGLIHLYTAEGTRYAQFQSYGDHQVINRPVSSKLPTPLHSLNGHGVLTEDSVSTPVGREGKGREGKEGNGGEGASAPGPPVIEFKIPESITAALDRCSHFKAAPKLRSAVFWQAMVRAYRGVDFGRELFEAQAWIVANPHKAPRSDLPAFLRRWFVKSAKEATA